MGNVRRVTILPALAALLFLLLPGCGALPGQTVALHPDVKVPAGNVGKGRTVALRVVDGRPDKVIGYRNMDGSRSAPIQVEGDLPQDIGLFASKALTDLGFQVIPPKEGASRSLTITVRDLSYKAEALTVSKKMTVKCVLAVRALSGSGGWEGSFPVTQEKEVVMTPDLDTNARFINEVLSESLGLMLSDPELVQFLGRDTLKGKPIGD